MGRSNKPEQTENEQPTYPAHTPPPADADAPARPAAQAPAQTATQAASPSAPNASSPAFNAPASPRAISETDALARDLRDGLVGGFVGVHSAISGETSFRGMLRVDGRASGRVSSQDGTLIVSAGGRVDANVDVAVAKINGTVNGDIKARERIEFGRTARVTGNIQTPALIIEQGAIFEGGCRMTTEQPAEQKAKERAATRPAVTPPAREVNRPAATPTAPAAPAVRESAAV